MASEQAIERVLTGLVEAGRLRGSSELGAIRRAIGQALDAGMGEVEISAFYPEGGGTAGEISSRTILLTEEAGRRADAPPPPASPEQLNEALTAAAPTPQTPTTLTPDQAFRAEQQRIADERAATQIAELEFEHGRFDPDTNTFADGTQIEITQGGDLLPAFAPEAPAAAAPRPGTGNVILGPGDTLVGPGGETLRAMPPDPVFGETFRNEQTGEVFRVQDGQLVPVPELSGFASIDPERTFAEGQRQFDVTQQGLAQRSVLTNVPGFLGAATNIVEAQRRILNEGGDVVLRRFLAAGEQPPAGLQTFTQADQLRGFNLPGLLNQFGGLTQALGFGAPGAGFGAPAGGAAAPTAAPAGGGFPPEVQAVIDKAARDAAIANALRASQAEADAAAGATATTTAGGGAITGLTPEQIAAANASNVIAPTPAPAPVITGQPTIGLEEAAQLSFGGGGGGMLPPQPSPVLTEADFRPIAPRVVEETPETIAPGAMFPTRITRPAPRFIEETPETFISGTPIRTGIRPPSTAAAGISGAQDELSVEDLARLFAVEGFAHGGFSRDKAIVGEAGKPELVTAMPGGGFMVEPIEGKPPKGVKRAQFGGLFGFPQAPDVTQTELQGFARETAFPNVRRVFQQGRAPVADQFSFALPTLRGFSRLSPEDLANADTALRLGAFGGRPTTVTNVEQAVRNRFLAPQGRGRASLAGF